MMSLGGQVPSKKMSGGSESLGAEVEYRRAQPYICYRRGCAWFGAVSGVADPLPKQRRPRRLAELQSSTGGHLIPQKLQYPLRTC